MIDDIVIDDELTIPAAELTWRFSLSSGPGGQHVQRNATRVELRWNVRTSAAPSDAVRERLLLRLAGRLSEDGEVRVFSAVGRSQYANRKRAAAALAAIVARALEPDRPRHATAVPPVTKVARRRDKRHRADVKRGRRRVGDEEG